MAWRPTEYLLEGELDNTTPGSVTGWMKFKGLPERVTFDLKGDFHRDIRGTKIHFAGDGKDADEQDAREYMDGLDQHQTGSVGDITAGLPPQDYADYPYLEWYGEHNGRVVIELDRQQVEVLGAPRPWREMEPISRTQQAENMGRFLAGLSQNLGVAAIVAGSNVKAEADCHFSHWIIRNGQIVGEAHSIQPVSRQMSCAYVRLFDAPELAGHGCVPSDQLLAKQL